MIFNTIDFVIFLLVVFFLYWKFFSKNSRNQNILLLIAGYFFYSWWSWKFLLLFIGTSLIDFYAAQKISQTEDPKKRKSFLILSLSGNLSVLLFFKYYNFFVTEFANLFSLDPNSFTLNIILPLGISFYTFQAMAYTIDVYRRTTPAQTDLLTYLCYSSFFPQLLSGPIERANHLMPQFERKREFNYRQGAKGLELMLFGYLKKVVLADNLAIIADRGFAFPNDYQGWDLVIAVLCFTFQIYCDFSGYTDIARGVARLFGFELIRNFNNPYFAENINDFWRRRHISLSTWFRDYLYIPLGGNKKGQLRTTFNIILVFAVSGLWHGASRTFLAWGLYHGILSALNRLLKIKVAPPKPIKIFITFLIVAFGLIFFRAASMPDAYSVMKHMFRFQSTISIFNNLEALKLILLFSTLFFVLALERINELKPEAFQTFFGKRVTKYSAYYYALILIIILGVYDNAPNFIYFQF
jgi:D-alanyl-lipoteichoic acid acyltransferase DltB (MBOAT superfamily)